MFYRQSCRLIAGLNARGVRHLAVGGLAVLAHGYTRLTLDKDVLLELADRDGISRAIAMLESAGYRPRAPAPIAQFADAAKR